MRFPCEDAKCAWIACTLDSEGTLYLKRNTHNWQVRFEVYNNNLDFLDALQANIGHAKIRRTIYKVKGSPSVKQRYILWIGSQQLLRELLPKILPYLIIKRKRCELMIEALKLKEKSGRSSPRLAEIYGLQGLRKSPSG